MKIRKAVLAITAIAAASCCVLFASDFGPVNMNADIAVPVPQPASALAQPDETGRFFRYFDDMFALPEALPLGAGANKSAADVSESRQGALVYSIKLEPIKEYFPLFRHDFQNFKGYSGAFKRA